jgi:hypothetical protein
MRYYKHARVFKSRSCRICQAKLLLDVQTLLRFGTTTADAERPTSAVRHGVSEMGIASLAKSFEISEDWD